MPQREPMSNIDTAWLRMEQPTNLMMITSVMIFADKLDVGRLKQILLSRFLNHRRFLQRAVRTTNGAYWEVDVHFDINRHVHRTALPGVADKTELQNLASDLMSTPLDFSKPLWQIHVVEDYQGGSALIMRVHHCYADGIALISVLLAMTDDAATPVECTTLQLQPAVDSAAATTMMQRLLQPLGSVFRFGKGVMREGLELLRDPGHGMVYFQHGSDIVAELAKLAMLPNDPASGFRGDLGVSKQVAWAEPLSLQDVKTVGRILGCSINDVLLAAVTGALRSYLLQRGENVDGLDIRAAVPVNLRPMGKTHNLGNYFGLVLLALPIGIENPLARLYRVRAYMQELKASYQAVVTFGLLELLGRVPEHLQRQALNLLSEKATAVMTNVPGPSKPIYLAGTELAEIMFWVPQSGGIGMGVSILSYNNRVQFGLVTDMNLVRDPQTVIDRFPCEFETLLLATMMQPWDEPPDPEQAEVVLRVGDR